MLTTNGIMRDSWHIHLYNGPESLIIVWVALAPTPYAIMPQLGVVKYEYLNRPGATWSEHAGRGKCYAVVPYR